MAKINTDPKKITELLTRGVDDVIDRAHLEEKLKSGKELRVKFGIDPTGSQLHLGHAIPLGKLREFQEMGHQVILLIGDYTAVIGDPTGRNETRPLLSHEQVSANMKTYIKQASKILDIKKVEIRYNSEWYAKPNFMGLLMELTGKMTVARVLERDDFQKRLKEGSDIRIQEMMYPLLQGYDSVMLQADVEIGGTDQKFNLLMGRKLQKRYNQTEQDILTTPILEGTDGEKKMSKSYDNFIALEEEPEVMFGKAMSIPDSLIIKYFTLATRLPLKDVVQYGKDMEAGKNPRDLKMVLAYEIVKMYHDAKKADNAREYFISTFSKKEMPSEIPEVRPTAYDAATVLVEAKICKSKSEARQVIDQGGIKVNEEKVAAGDYGHALKPGDIVQKGSRWFVKVK